ncbi:MAG TPA: heme-binding protein [Steroidobacteraceae bacterium]|nr:heme-binding protein [Steroidobacteraceae bacterium]
MKTSIIAAAALALGLPALARQAASAPPPQQLPPPPPRAKGPALAPAVRASQAAVAACAAKGYHVTTLIVDSAGEPVVLLSGDGASLLSQRFARIKIAVVMKYKLSSGEVAARARTDARLDEQIKADPHIGIALAGAVPLMRGGEFIGAFAVSGAGGPQMDEACVKEALARVSVR